MTTLHHRRTPLPVALAAAFAALILTACNMTAPEQQSYSIVNNLRSSAGVATLLPDDELTTLARAHSEAMAREGRLFHSDLNALPVTGWTSIGENVARASSVEEATQRLIASPTHHANMMSAVFNRIGVGVYHAPDGTVWLTQLFLAR